MHVEAEATLGQLSAPIVPRDTVTGRALLIVIAIMTFVAALTVGVLDVVRNAAMQWRTDMTREMTIQVKPSQGRDLGAEIAKAVAIARRTTGILDARALSREESARLLEPWLGGGVDLDVLPLPRLVAVSVSERIEPDLPALRTALAKEITGATLDDHRRWSARLDATAGAIAGAGLAVLALVLAATVLSVSFATRGAIAVNRAVVEVLHFVGARDGFIAGTFQRHFLAVGLKGGLIGGSAAAALFALASFAPALLSRVPGGIDSTFLTGQIALTWEGYGGIAALVILVALVTTVASRLTVRRALRQID
jgi:cell division transport system permease protein